MQIQGTYGFSFLVFFKLPFVSIIVLILLEKKIFQISAQYLK